MMKKITAAAVAMSLVFCLLSGCSTASEGNESQEGVIILAADFAEYDWIRAILGDNPSDIELHRLNETGADMHSYQPTVADMAQISDCSLLVYSGGESEFWITDAAESSNKTSESILSLMEVLAHDPELSEKYEGTAGVHNHEHEHHDEHDHSEEYDEHMWLSLKSSPVFIERITEAISGLDPQNSAIYEQNARNYIEEIRRLDLEFEKMVSEAKKQGHDTILMADRFPFAYLMADYGLNYIAAFPGCYAETEASFATILSLSEAIDNCGLDTVFVMKKSDTSLAQTIIQNSSSEDVTILTLDSMQSVTSKDVQKGEKYLSVMENNLAALSAALIK